MQTRMAFFLRVAALGHINIIKRRSIDRPGLPRHVPIKNWHVPGRHGRDLLRKLVVARNLASLALMENDVSRMKPARPKFSWLAAHLALLKNCEGTKKTGHKAGQSFIHNFKNKNLTGLVNG